MRAKRVLFTCNRADFDARELLHGVSCNPATNRWILRVYAYPQNRSQWRAWMKDFKPDGVIIFSPLNEEIHADLREGHLPHVFLTWGDEPVKNDCVLLTEEEALGGVAAAHFLEKKFQHFAVVSYAGISHMVKRKKGFIQALAKLGLPCLTYDADLQKAPLKPYGEHIPENFYQWVKDLPRPCALFACDDEIGVVVIEVCRHLGIEVPKEIAVLGAANDVQACRIIAPRLSSVSIPFVAIGREAAGLLDKWMMGVAPSPGVHLFRPIEVVVRSSTEIQKTTDAVVGRALNYIAEHFGRAMRVTDLQRHTGVSAKTLEMRFKAELRRTPIEEIRRHRIEQAKRLLAETDLSVAEIATKCGFKRAHKFSTVFKELTNNRPLDYRRAHKSL